jgi:hypothetical protein
LRKEAKLQQRFLRKSILVIPHLSNLIGQTVSTIETALEPQTRRTQQLYWEFVHELSADGDVSSRLQEILTKMVTELSLPHECLTIACIYINRAVSNMQKKEFFLSSPLVER